MISVIIPLYNKANYIAKTVSSVLKQNFKEFELLVVNDGSKDNSLDIVSEIKDERLKIIDQKNSGVSTARNNGVKAATHDFVAFLDADDWWDENHLNEMASLIKKYPDAAIFAAKYSQVKNNQIKEALIGVEDNFDEGYINYFQTYSKTMWMPLYPSCVIIKKSVYNEVGGFKPNLKLGEDFDLWARIACEHKVAYKNKSLVYYNQDVEVENRGVNPKRFYKPNENFIFNLGYLEEYEEKNDDLKLLLDKLKCENLFRYYLVKKYITEVNSIIKKIEFRNLPFIYYYKYNYPFFLVKFLFLLRKKISILKSFFK